MMMKSNYLFTLIAIITTTSTLISFGNLKIAYAQSQPVVEQTGCVGEPQAYIPPENLVSLAYQGYLEKQGIPGDQQLEANFADGQITGEKIVQAAVAGCLLSDQYGVSNHSNYIKEVETQLQMLIEENRGR